MGTKLEATGAGVQFLEKSTTKMKLDSMTRVFLPHHSITLYCLISSLKTPSQVSKGDVIHHSQQVKTVGTEETDGSTLSSTCFLQRTRVPSTCTGRLKNACKSSSRGILCPLLATKGNCNHMRICPPTPQHTHTLK